MFFKKKHKNRNKGGKSMSKAFSKKERKNSISQQQRDMINWQILSKRRLLIYAESEC